jgi:hypothetical protein
VRVRARVRVRVRKTGMVQAGAAGLGMLPQRGLPAHPLLRRDRWRPPHMLS